MYDPNLIEEAKRRLLAGAKPHTLWKEIPISRYECFRLRDELGLPKRAWNSPAQYNAGDYTNLNFERNMKMRIHLLRGRAKRRGVPFELVYSDLCTLFNDQNGLCFYTDQPMVWDRSAGQSRKALSVDRIDSTRGYVAGNVVLCSWRANAIKNDLTMEELKQWMPSWHQRLQDKIKSLSAEALLP